MERTPHINDIVEILEPAGDLILFVIENINNDVIYLRNINTSKNIQLIIKNNEWKVKGTNINYSINIINKILFTKNRDIDIEILLNLNDELLTIVCQTNKYSNRLCNNDFWKLKINNLYPGFPIPNRFINQGKKLYFIIKQLNIDLILYWAIEYGYIDILEWIKKYNVSFDRAINIAIKYNQLNVLKWLYKHLWNKSK